MTNDLLERGPYISNSFLHQFPELVVSRRGNIVKLCELAGLPKEAFTGVHRLIPLDQFVRLLEVTEIELDLPEIALLLAQRQDITILGPISVMLYDCETFSDALHVITQYMRLVVSGLEVQIVKSPQLVEIKFHCSTPGLLQHAQFQNYVLASTFKVFKLLIDQKLVLRGCFSMLPEPSEAQSRKFVHFFGCPVAFDADRTGLTLNGLVMQQPYENTGETITRRINAMLESQSDVVEQVCKSITFCLPSGKADLEMVAKSMGCSKTTLHRKLAASSTSFRALLDSIRLSHANQYLKNTHYSLTDISDLLGYQNPSAFTRSYKRWTGILPITVRQASVDTQ